MTLILRGRGRATWWISTPDWTIQVTHRDFVITDIAPCLRARWQGHDWGTFTDWVRCRYPGHVHARRLPPLPEETSS